MAQNTTVGVNIKVEGKQAEQSVGNIKKQLREAQQDVVRLSEKFGATSKEATEAAKRAAQLRDAIGDAKALTDAFSPDAKFAAFSGAISGVVSGFSALQGAQALFGTQSQELEQTLLKVQAAMALSQGLNGILGAKDAFVNLAAVVKTQVVAAFGTLRSAIISTGIGALVVAVGLLIANFDKVKQAIVNLIPGGKEFFELIGDITDAIGDWFGASEDVLDTQKALKEATEQLSQALSGYYEEIDRTVKLEQLRARVAGKAIGDGEQEIEQLRRKIQFNKDLLSAAKGTVAEAAANITLTKEITGLEQKLEEAILKRSATQSEAARKAAADAAKERAEAQRRALEEIERRNNALPKQLQDINRSLAEEGRTVLQQQLSDTKTALEQDAANREAINARIVENRRGALREIIAADEAEAESKMRTMELVANTANTFANLVGRQTAAGKALAIAGATINTYKGASEALKADYGVFGPAAQIARIATVASVIATGLQQVKAIASVKVPGNGGGGAGAPQAPRPVLPQATTTQLDANSINQIGNAAGRAFVLETDVTNNQERIRRLNRAARIN